MSERLISRVLSNLSYRVEQWWWCRVSNRRIYREITTMDRELAMRVLSETTRRRMADRRTSATTDRTQPD